MVNRHIGPTADSALDLSAALIVGGFRLDTTDCVARGGPQALLQPAYNHGFRVCVDPTPRSRDGAGRMMLTQATRRHRTRFLTAHEIGHSFFYDRAAEQPRRIFPVGDFGEEDFCSEFARSLLVPPSAVTSSGATAAGIFSLATVFDVSAEVAARAVASMHPSRPFVALALIPARSS